MRRPALFLGDSMTDQEIQPFVDKNARVTLADGRVFAGKLSKTGSGYTVVTPAADKHTSDSTERIASGDQIAQVEEAPEFSQS